ncbi:DUF998 domain-containing protein [Streptomyces sp. NPDC048566]|uniref:DUF998 domain-containing protein n=1 Tax=Streptomyces sp. NPDC048566 TaxID=3365569 RepID=UPI0037198534
MAHVPRWVLLSSGCAPVLFTAGWVLAAHLVGPTYDPVTQTISVLAAYGEAGFRVMTGALLALGICHLLTAWGLRPVPVPGRLALAGGGVAALVVAVVPAPMSGGSLRHGTAAAIGFALLALWPVLSADARATAPWALRRIPSITATSVMVAGAAWFLVETQRHGDIGVAERFVTGVQSLWPFVVVASCVRHTRGPSGARA